MCRCRTNVPTITSVLAAWGGLHPHSGLWAGDPRLVGGVKALQGLLSRTLSHCIVCKFVSKCSAGVWSWRYAWCSCRPMSMRPSGTTHYGSLPSKTCWSAGGRPGPRRWGGSACGGGWEARKGRSGAGQGVAAVQLYAFHEQTCAEQLGEHASQRWSAFRPARPPAAALLLWGTPSGEGPEDPLHPTGRWARGEGWGRLTAWPELGSLDHPDALPMPFAVPRGPLCWEGDPHAKGWRELPGRVDGLQRGEPSISRGTWMGKDSKQRPVGTTRSPAS